MNRSHFRLQPRFAQATAFAWFVSFGFLYLLLTKHSPPTFEWGTFAHSLIEHGTYAWNDRAPWDMGNAAGFSAHKPPLVSLMLAAVWSILPATLTPYVTVVLNAALETLAWMAVCQLVAPALRVWVSAAFVLSPFVLMNVPVVSDAPATHALLAWGCYFIIRCEGAWRRAALAGVCMGAACLSSAANVVAATLGCLWLWLDDQGRRPMLAFALAAAAVVSPWAARNAFVFHRFVPLTSNLALELYFGNNPQATGGMFDDACTQVTLLDNAHKATLRGRDEVAGYALLGDEARRWAIDNPRRALRLRLRAWAYFWHPQAFWLGHCPAYAGMRWRALGTVNVVYLLVAAAGLIEVFWRFSRRVFDFAAASLLALSLLYAATHADIGWRYRAPIEPMLCVLIGVAARALRRWASTRRPFDGAGGPGV